MDLSKYTWKNRLLLIQTPSYSNKKYIKTKQIYEDNIKDFHKRFIKLITHKKKDFEFQILLIGFDGDVKENYTKLLPSTVFKSVDSMPMGKIMKENPKINPQNLSLYSDYNKETTMSGLGFKDKEKALYTIEAIKDRPIKYQTSVVATMIGRAKNHPHQTENMKDAIKVFQAWMKKHKKNSN